MTTISQNNIKNRRMRRNTETDGRRLTTSGLATKQTSRSRKRNVVADLRSICSTVLVHPFVSIAHTYFVLLLHNIEKPRCCLLLFIQLMRAERDRHCRTTAVDHQLWAKCTLESLEQQAARSSTENRKGQCGYKNIPRKERMLVGVGVEVEVDGTNGTGKTVSNLFLIV